MHFSPLSDEPLASSNGRPHARRLTVTKGLLYLALAALSIKSLQEIGGVRPVSLFLPLALFASFSYRPAELALPAAVKLYALYIAVVTVPVSLVASGTVTFYIGYLLCTLACAILLLIVATRKLSMSPLEIGRAYADAMTVVCLLSVATIEKQWFGGYTLRTFSDFAPLFGLQLSVAVPFLGGRHKNVKRLICLTTLFFSFTRTSLVFAALIMLVQLAQEGRAVFMRGAAVIIIALTVGVLFSDLGALMFDKLANVVSVVTGGGAEPAEINPSDLGRLAYAAATFEALSNAKAIAIGHGIKTNRMIIAERLDVSEWGLDESMADATVHNVYLEMLSDSGLLGVGVFLAFVGYAAIRIVRGYGALSPPALSFFAFSLSYLFEANYVTFFFQFFFCFYLWLAAAAPKKAMPRIKRIRVPRRVARRRAQGQLPSIGEC